jgi:hypothetical protein
MAEGYSIARGLGFRRSEAALSAVTRGLRRPEFHLRHSVDQMGHFPWIVDGVDSYRFFSSFRYAGVMILKGIA